MAQRLEQNIATTDQGVTPKTFLQKFNATSWTNLKNFVDIILRSIGTNQMKLDFALKQDSSIIRIEMNGTNST